MLLTTQNIFDNFHDFLSSHPDSHIGIMGNFGTNNDAFFEKMAQFPFFQEKNTLVVTETEKKPLLHAVKKQTGNSFDYILFATEIFSFTELKELLEKHEIIGKIVFFTREVLTESDMDIFYIPSLSFREYTEQLDTKVSIQEILKEGADMKKLEWLASSYLESGSFVKNIENPNAIFEDFSKKRTIIHQELFEKERADFDQFLGTMAMNVSNLYKEDYIAKTLNISRRKVKKYTELLIKYDIIRPIQPFFEDTEKELSRHEKFYFSDLSYYRGAMGQAYGLWNSKISLMENFIFLELSRKLKDTHSLFFWKKKSGTSLAFVLKNKESGKLTPIEVWLSSSKDISQTMKSFYDSYNGRIEYGMFLNEGKIVANSFSGTPFLTLPYYTI